MSDTWTVERSIHVDAPASAVYDRLVDFRRWRAWSPFERLDPAMERTHSGAEAGVDAVYEWAGNARAGAGRMRIVDTVVDHKVVVEQRNRKPIWSESVSTFVLDDSGSGTVVTWSATGARTLVTRVMGLFTSMERVLAPAFEEGLANLRDDVESA